jgi:arylsulfatase
MVRIPAVLSICLAWAACAPSARVSERPPNIVFILADDLGYGELGCFGQQLIRTPRLDRLAAEGMRFTHFYSGNAVCAPSRCSFMTGKHPGHAHVRSNGNPPERRNPPAGTDDFWPGQHPLPFSERTVAELLKERGYATGAIGKWGLGHEGSTGEPNRRGFDFWYGYLCQGHAHNHYPRFLWRNREKEFLEGNTHGATGRHYAQDRFSAEALRFVRENRERPFFLYLPFTISHASLQVPEEAVADYRGRIPETPYEHRDRYVPHPTPHAAYAAMVTYLDRAVGSLLDLLRELGLDERTLVVFSSDNGPTHDRVGGADSPFFKSAGPFRGLKGSLYEGGIRVPTIARWPGRVPAGSVSAHPAAFWDLLPTFAELAGAAPPPGIDGLSLVPTLLGRPGEQRAHEFLYWEFPSYGGQQAVRAGSWKAVRQGMLQKGNADPLRIELYDLEKDPGETTDVAAAHPEIVARMAAVMKREHVPHPLWPFPAIDRP